MKYDWFEWVDLCVESIYKELQKMNAQIVALSAQVAANVAAEGAAVKAIANLNDQVAALKMQLASAVENGFGNDDVAALNAAVNDLSASATSLSAAVPAPTA